ncbi:4569_t:CDS:2 [Funneliformis caledonium]|uniref:4569_t:CDS:1 n=1 Tax=Funneliformis caledonium TaxID=1117310 RepID=A0A9N9AE71_9GLOM|nr:4569_t:CDS:2 [Funneliformis caledonium]
MSTEESNNGVIFVKVPEDLPVINEHFKFIERKINISSTVLEKGEILIKNVYLSLDPYMRGRMRVSEKNEKNYINAFSVGKVMEAGGVGVVIASNNDQWKKGDLFSGYIGWEEYTKVSPAAAKNALLYKQALKDALDNDISLSYFLGLLGMPGMTAYVGLFMIGKPKQGETIFISTAAGAVGQVVGQIAKIKGLKVVGSTGDDSKVDYILNELKFDHAFNYKKVDIDQTLKETCPEGIDIYFDNFGGETLDIVLTHLNINARVIACGMISQYNNAKSTSYGIKNLGLIIPRRIIVHGFIVFDHYKEYYESFQKDMVQWLKEGKLKYKEYVVNGIENAPQAFLDMFNGKNFGKLIIKISDL